jgi:hypothetical protein
LVKERSTTGKGLLFYLILQKQQKKGMSSAHPPRWSQ